VNLSKFSAECRKRSEHPQGFGKPIDTWSVAHYFMAMLGELGEAANAAKKLQRIESGLRGNKPGENPQALWENLGDELADTLIYLCLICERIGIDLSAAAIRKFNEKSDEIGYPFVLTEETVNEVPGN
jgi:NTP pyrophosphatase (non-canonical NTP hydrolase)